MKGSLLTSTADGGEVAEGVDAGGAADPTADEVGSALAMDDPSLLATALAEAVAASGPDADDTPVAAPTCISAYINKHIMHDDTGLEYFLHLT
jgi:hypothetical protein